MLPARHDPATPPPHVPHLELATTTTSDDVREDLPFEAGLVRSLAIGGGLGFLLVFVIVTIGILLTGFGWATAVASGAFVGAFAGVGFGGMTGAAIHTPRR